jgi:hypothetical protein
MPEIFKRSGIYIFRLAQGNRGDKNYTYVCLINIYCKANKALTALPG